MSIKYIRERGAFVMKCDRIGCNSQVVIKDDIVFNKDQTMLYEKIKGWVPLHPTVYGMRLDKRNKTNHICPECYKLATAATQYEEMKEKESINEESQGNENQED